MKIKVSIIFCRLIQKIYSILSTQVFLLPNHNAKCLWTAVTMITSSVLNVVESNPDLKHYMEDYSWFSQFKKMRSEKKIRRVCQKNGTPNVKYKNVSERKRRYIFDIYTTLVDSTWKTSLVLFAARYFSNNT